MINTTIIAVVLFSLQGQGRFTVQLLTKIAGRRRIPGDWLPKKALHGYARLDGSWTIELYILLSLLSILLRSYFSHGLLRLEMGLQPSSSSAHLKLEGSFDLHQKVDQSQLWRFVRQIRPSFPNNGVFCIPESLLLVSVWGFVKSIRPLGAPTPATPEWVRRTRIVFCTGIVLYLLYSITI